MRTYVHGGDKYGLSGQAKTLNDSGDAGSNSLEIIDFSANTNPLGMPEKVVKAAMESIINSESYPDPFNRKLTEKICEFESKLAGYKVEKDWVVCGNGAADLIFRGAFVSDLKKVLVLAPTFSEYEEALKQKNVQVVHYYLKKENEFSLTEDFLKEMDESIDGIFICNPNNPVGNLVDKRLLFEILKKAKENNILLFLDECFLELTGELSSRSLVGQLKDFENLIILKAFTKTYAMAGLRLGYLLTSNVELADRIFNCGQPWSVSTPAQAAGVVALDQVEYVSRSIEYIVNERSCLQRELEQMGCQVFSGAANYIFFYHKDGKRFVDEMKKRGILVRDCENYQGLYEGYMRIAVRNREENKVFIERAKEVLNG